MSEESDFIYTHRPLTNGKITIVQNIPVSGEPPEDFPEFVVHISVAVGVNKQTGEPIVANGVVPIQADSIEQAFADAPGVMDKAAEDVKRQARSEMIKATLKTPPMISKNNGHLRLRT